MTVGMKLKTVRSLVLSVSCWSLAGVASADLYVVEVDGGGAAPTDTSAAAIIKKLSNLGAPLATINLPIVDSLPQKAFSIRGNSTTATNLTLSTNGEFLLLGGFGVAPGQTVVHGATSVVAPRAVARIKVSDGSFDTTTVFSGDSSYNGVSSGSSGEIRSVASTDGVTLWTSGTSNTSGNAGIRTATFGGTTTTQISTSVTNTRVLNISSVSGSPQLYLGTMSGTFRGVNTVGTGLPIVAGATVALFPGFVPLASAPQNTNDFWLKDANTLYLADGRSAAPGGVQKWTFDSGTALWSLAYSSLLGTTGAFSLAGTIEGADTVLYSTSGESTNNNIVKLIDTGAGFTQSNVAMAGANKVFRGLEFVAAALPTNNSDFDNDGTVDGNDLLKWQGGLGLTGVPVNVKSTGDANGDGNVNAADLAIWTGKFGGPPAVAAIGAAPEPMSLGLALAALAALATRRRAA